LKGEINATVCSEEERLEVEGGADRWGPSGSEKERKGEGTGSVEVVGRGLLGWLLPCWAGSSLVSPVRLSLSFFCSVTLSIFCFSFSFMSFAKLTQMTSNQMQMFSKNQGIKVGQ
jgi:hypothetical protein